MWRDGDDTYPLPVISKSFYVPTRQLEQSHKLNQPICTDDASSAAQSVAQKVEQIVLGIGEPHTFIDNVSLYGMCNHPNRITQTFTCPYLKNGERNPEWSTSVFYKEFGGAEALLRDKGFNERVAVFVSDDLMVYLPSSVLASVFIPHPLLPPGTVVLCEMSQETLQIYYGIDVSTVQWNSDNPDEIEMMVMCSIVPFIRKNHCGIVHLTAR